MNPFLSTQQPPPQSESNDFLNPSIQTVMAIKESCILRGVMSGVIGKINKISQSMIINFY
jgi:hypothetical protein